jgi:hypothetical protein
MESKNVFVTSSVLSNPSANSFTVFLPNFLKDVYKVELLSASYTAGSVAQHVYLDVEELRSPVFNMTATATVNSPTVSSSAFAVLTGMKTVTGSLINWSSAANYPVTVDYPYPIQRVDRFTVHWTDNKGSPLTLTGESSFLLRVHTLRKNMGPTTM